MDEETPWRPLLNHQHVAAGIEEGHIDLEAHPESVDRAATLEEHPLTGRKLDRPSQPTRPFAPCLWDGDRPVNASGIDQRREFHEPAPYAPRPTCWDVGCCTEWAGQDSNLRHEG